MSRNIIIMSSTWKWQNKFPPSTVWPAQLCPKTYVTFEVYQTRACAQSEGCWIRFSCLRATYSPTGETETTMALCWWLKIDTCDAHRNRVASTGTELYSCQVESEEESILVTIKKRRSLFDVVSQTGDTGHIFFRQLPNLATIISDSKLRLPRTPTSAWLNGLRWRNIGSHNASIARPSVLNICDLWFQIAQYCRFGKNTSER